MGLVYITIHEWLISKVFMWVNMQTSHGSVMGLNFSGFQSLVHLQVATKSGAVAQCHHQPNAYGLWPCKQVPKMEIREESGDEMGGLDSRFLC